LLEQEARKALYSPSVGEGERKTKSLKGSECSKKLRMASAFTHRFMICKGVQELQNPLRSSKSQKLRRDSISIRVGEAHNLEFAEEKRDKAEALERSKFP
jgi:hypothetical protein